MADNYLMKDIRGELRHQAVLRREKELAEARAGSITTLRAARIVWRGTNVQFADAILQMFHEGMIVADSPTHALRQASEHFSREDGKPMVAKSLLQGLKNKGMR